MALSLHSSIRLATGYHIPLLGFGVYQNYDTKASVTQAFAAGYRHIDTAQAYRNEAEVGAAFRASELKREDVFITTKCVSKTHGYASTLAGVDASLEKMSLGRYIILFIRTELSFSEYIDLFLIHDPFSGTQRRLDTYRALLDAQKAGKIRSVGVSNYGIKHLEEIRNAQMQMPAVNQIELHPFCQQKPIVEYCTRHSVVVQAYCPLVRGNFQDSAITQLASKYSRDPAQILLRWSLQSGYVPLPKSSTPSRIVSNTILYDFELSSDDMNELNALDRGKNGSISWNPVDAD